MRLTRSARAIGVFTPLYGEGQTGEVLYARLTYVRRVGLDVEQIGVVALSVSARRASRLPTGLLTSLPTEVNFVC